MDEYFHVDLSVMCVCKITRNWEWDFGVGVMGMVWYGIYQVDW